MNFPSDEHRAVFPITSSALMLTSESQIKDGASMYADFAEFGFPPPGAKGRTFTQHAGSETVLAKPLTGELQSVGAASQAYVEQVNCVELTSNKYPLVGTLPKVCLEDAGIGQETGPEGIASVLVDGVASGLFGSTSFGSEVPPSQPTRRSARAEIPKKKFFIFRSPFLRCNFPHPERDVKLSFSHLVMQRDKCSYLR